MPFSFRRMTDISRHELAETPEKESESETPTREKEGLLGIVRTGQRWRRRNVRDSRWS